MAKTEENLADVAILIMRQCNEAASCPFCGIDDGEHEEGKLCARLQDQLDALKEDEDIDDDEDSDTDDDDEDTEPSS